MKAYCYSHLADHVLLRELAAALSNERAGTATVLAHLAEVDARKLYLPAAYPSMFTYCVGELHLSEEAAFKRIHLKPGETQRVTLTVDPRSIGQVNEKGDRVVMPGEYTLYLGGSQPGDGASVQTVKFTVTGNATLPK